MVGPERRATPRAQLGNAGLTPVQREQPVDRPGRGRRGGRPAARRRQRGRRGRPGGDRHRRVRGDRHARAHGAADHAARSHAVRVAVLARRPLERARRLAGLGRGGARRAWPRAGHEALDVRLARDGRWTHDGRAARARAGRRPAGRRRGLPGAARAVRRGRHGAGPARAARRALRGRRRDGARRCRMDKALFKDLMAAHGMPQVDYVAVREGERAGSALAACRCSSSPRASARRWASRRPGRRPS